MEPLLTVRQRILVALGLLVFALVTLVWIPRLRDEEKRADTQALQVLVRGRIEGVPSDRIDETRILVKVEAWSPYPVLIVPTPGQDSSEKVKEEPIVLVRILPSGEYEADVTGLCAAIDGEAVVKLTITHPLCVPASQRARVRVGPLAGRHEIRVDIELDLAVQITGTVSGRGAADIRISLYDLTETLGFKKEDQIPSSGDHDVIQPQKNVEPDDQGNFRLRAARDHLLLILVHAEQRLPAWRVIEPSDARVADLGPLVLEVGEAIEGTLTAPAPLTGWSVFARRPSSNGLWLGTGRMYGGFIWTKGGPRPGLREVPVDDTGRFRFEGLPRGRRILSLQFEDREHRMGGMYALEPLLESAEQAVSVPAESVKLEVDAASVLRVGMTNAHGAPAFGRYLLELGQHRGVKIDSAGPLIVPADEPFRIKPRPGGPKFTAMEGKTAAAGEERTVSIQLDSKKPSGRVRFTLPANRAFSNCSVTWTRDGYAPTSGFMNWRHLDLSSGSGTLERMAPGRYVFRVSPELGGAGAELGWWIGKPVEANVRSGEESAVEVPLEEGGRFEVHVTHADTGAFQRCRVRLGWPSGKLTFPVLLFRGAQPDKTSVTNRTRGGNPNLGQDPLPAGSYTLYFSQPGFQTETRTVRIEPRRTTRVSVALRPR